MSFLASVRHLIGLKPTLPAWAASAGVVQNADGSVTMPDGTTGQIQTDGTILTSDGQTVADPAGNAPDKPHDNPTTTGVPIDLSEMWRESKGALIGGAIGVVIGAALGGAAIPVAARAGAITGAALTGPLGAWIGYKVS